MTKIIGTLILICLALPFICIGFVTGLIFRIAENGFNIGYSCLALKYVKELNQEIREVQSQINNN